MGTVNIWRIQELSVLFLQLFQVEIYSKRKSKNGKEYIYHRYGKNILILIVESSSKTCVLKKI